MRVFKDTRGNWKACETHKLGGAFELDVTTFKRDGGAIVTIATVHKRDGGFLVHRMHQDYSDRIGIARFRATERAIGEHHAAMVKQAGGIETILQCARAHHRADLAETATS